ncbi:MAG: TadA family conjugal transfer-associated ATPase [Actinobacteria bacterium]|nr:TadA family conjugal transfer-associated ATPase [Actinomycetota bacterium]MCB8997923.1 TadA family conjugal transfer-associated ATPase [Actinomycetota bacterium]MCB9414480.1 TadA family conjugal transfer-associated ATPase [Actinomycetota bacterium]HRY08740.1 TadA family conjugal transfer-associated ATPase [Candidatus Nanopelagicales bacterium]
MTAPEPLVDRVRRRLVQEGWAATPVSVTDALRAEGLVLPESSIVEVVRALRTELAGLGALESLVAADGVTDVLVNGPFEVWVDAGDGLTRTDVRFPDEAAVRRLAQRLAGSVGRRLDDSVPYVDARLPNGIRLHAVLPPISGQGTCLSLRVPRRRVFTLADLVEVGMVPREGVAILSQLVSRRSAFLVSGGTGSGKTTLLNSLLSVVDPAERLVVVEDSAELQPAHPHVVRLEARPPNTEGSGAVTVRDLVRQALRMRPDRLVVGEVRGAEVVDLLSALNTGHEGGCGTVHANSAADVPARLESLAMPAGLTRAGLHAQVAAGLAAVVHLVRDPRRRVAGIAVLVAGDDGLVSSVPAVVFRDDRTVRGPGASRLL